MNEHATWLRAQVAREATTARNASEKETYPYQAQFVIIVAGTEERGSAHQASERSDRPDLTLRVRMPGGQQLKVGEKDNSLQMIVEHPIQLKKGDTVQIRLANRKESYYRLTYEARDAVDWGVSLEEERPLSQFSFTFEGSGRYFFHEGFAMFFVDFRRLH